MKINNINRRGGAGKVELKGGSGGIIKMCPVKDFLEVYKIDKTFKIYTPETLDPKQEDPNMSSIVTSVDGIGSGNYIVARLFIQTSEALEKNILKDSISAKDILSLSYDCKEFLLSCKSAYNEYSKKQEVCFNEFNNGNVIREGSFYPSFPTIDNLDHIAVTFLINAKKFIETEAKIFNVFFGTQFYGPRFDKIIQWTEKEIPQDIAFIEFLSKSNDYLKYITELRNKQEHPQKKLKLHVNNFRLLPNSKIGVPTWNITDTHEADIKSDMENIVYFLLNFHENLLFRSIMIHMDTRFPYELVEINKKERDVNCPIKYKFAINNKYFLNKS
ncbi:MAG: hypothetical protein KAW47_03995 [Thermoplasmatales archaeon]|nr:hypothetical protein [Thermoplasmatales archaeon]